MSQKRILFAADEKLVGVLAEPLRKAGLTVETFSRQSDLLQAAGGERPDALLLGARLPDATALAVFRALEATGTPPPTVVILAPSQLPAREALLKAGIADVAVSPIRPRLLAARLVELSGGVRRNDVREKVAVAVTVDAGGRQLSGTTVDVSREGVGLRLAEPLDAGQLVSIALAPLQAPAMRLLGRVLHSRPEGAQQAVGVRFLGLSADEENALVALPKTEPAELPEELSGDEFQPLEALTEAPVFEAPGEAAPPAPVEAAPAAPAPQPALDNPFLDATPPPAPVDPGAPAPAADEWGLPPAPSAQTLGDPWALPASAPPAPVDAPAPIEAAPAPVDGTPAPVLDPAALPAAPALADGAPAELVEKTPPALAPTVPAPAAIAAKPRRNPLVVAVIVLLILAGGGAAAFFALQAHVAPQAALPEPSAPVAQAPAAPSPAPAPAAPAAAPAPTDTAAAAAAAAAAAELPVDGAAPAPAAAAVAVDAQAPAAAVPASAPTPAAVVPATAPAGAAPAAAAPSPAAPAPAAAGAAPTTAP